MQARSTALLLIGYQNDYFASDGVLHGVVEASLKANDVLGNTLRLIESVQETDVKVISTPIRFTDDYSEIVEPVGILGTIRDAGAFRASSKGGAVIDEIVAFGDRITEVPGKRGLNAFSNTDLEELLRRNGITDVAIAGVVTSLCIDSTARHAFEAGFRVHVVSDCTSGRTQVEQSFYCDEVFPLYSRVVDSKSLVTDLSTVEVV